jgi:membrane protease YdiL (CAAX protease family)
VNARTGTILLTALTAVLVFLFVHDLEPGARVWTTLLVAVLPPLSIAQARLLDDVALPPRSSLYLQSAASLWALAAITAIIAVTGDITAAQLGLTPLPLVEVLVWTGGLTFAGVAMMLAAHRLGVRESATLAGLLPRTAPERLAFVGLSLTAGFCEELVFRGFLVPAITTAVDASVVAALIAAAVFGLVHAYQGFAGALRAAALGVLLAVPLLATGSILPAILAHAAIDLIGGLWLGPRLVSE